MKIGQKIYLYENQLSQNFETTLKETDTCFMVICERLKSYFQNRGIDTTYFHLLSISVSKNLPKKHIKKEIVKF